MESRHARPVLKVLAYITRDTLGGRQLLVFRHRDFPEAGVQVPAGTVKTGEPVEAALRREVLEETGFDHFRVVTKLGVFRYLTSAGKTHERHVYHLEALGALPDAWEWMETDGGEVAELEGYVFQYGWMDLVPCPELAAGQGDYLHLLPGE